MTQEMKAMIELVNKSSKEVKPMSKADKMFEELGYEKEENEEEILYAFKDRWVLCFGKEFKEYYTHDYVGVNNFVGNAVSINVNEHLAINEKMKELGWLNEQSI